MAALDFPGSPSDGDTYSANGTRWKYDSTVGAWLPANRLREPEFVITDGAGFVIDPNNGGQQRVTLGANRTPTAANWSDGDYVLLWVADGTAYTLTLTSVVDEWIGSPPTLATSGYTGIEIFQRGSTRIAKHIGDVAA